MMSLITTTSCIRAPLFLLIVAALPRPIVSVVGVDVSSRIDSDAWNCLQTPGGQGVIEFAIPRVHRSTGSVDPNGRSNIENAIAAGIKHVDGYIFPCVPCGNPAAQVNATVRELDGVGYGMLWYDVERYKWSANLTENREFIIAMIEAGLELGVTAGIYAGRTSWSAIVGTDWSYASDKGLPNWYAHYESTPNPSFSDWKAFGGWSAPAIKQYMGSHTSCGVGVDYDWYPDSSDWREEAAMRQQQQPTH